MTLLLNRGKGIFLVREQGSAHFNHRVRTRPVVGRFECLDCASELVLPSYFNLTWEAQLEAIPLTKNQLTITHLRGDGAIAKAGNYKFEASVRTMRFLHAFHRLDDLEEEKEGC